MSELFLNLVNMSISASWLILAVIVIRFALKNVPKWVNVLMWGIVAVRLICPISIESVLSLIPSMETISSETLSDKNPIINSGIPAINHTVNHIMSDGNTAPIGDSVNSVQFTLTMFATIWIGGMLLLMFYTIVSYWKLYREVRNSVCLRNNIFQSANVGSPFVLGFLQPKIYLPFHLEKESLDYVVAHEQAHIYRKDYLWKPFGFLLLTIYWFNPFMWVAYMLLSRDIELACDEKVIKTLGREEKADYSQALLSCSIKQRMITACPLAFGEVGVKERVKFVLNYKKPAFWVIVLSIIACTIIGVCFLTNPKESIPMMKSDIILSYNEEGYQQWEGNQTAFGTDILRSDVKTITFFDTLENAPSDAIDISEKQNKSVLMWVVKDDTLYNMYIAGDGGVAAPLKCVSLFACYDNLIEIDFGNCFDTSNVFDMRQMFNCCRKLSHIDVSSFDTSNVIDMSYMFAFCFELKQIDVNGWDTSNVRDMTSMFNGCSMMTDIKVNDWNTSNVRNMAAMFCGCLNLESIVIEDWDTSSVTNMAGMFSSCRGLSNIAISNWDTSSVTNMAGMFSSCSELSNIEISNWDTSNVTSMCSMFSNCSGLTNINIGDWNTSNVTNMSNMFSNCEKLTTIDIGDWNTLNVTNISSMFALCYELMNVKVDNWNTSKVINMSYMFEDCHALTDIEVSNWNTISVTDMRGMFKECHALIDIEVSNWNTIRVTDMRSMFEECTSLQNHPRIPIPDNAKTTLIYFGTEWSIHDTEYEKEDMIIYDVEKIEVVTADGVTETNIWTACKGISMKFTVNGDYSKFKYVEIDGNVLYLHYYTVENDGSTICILADYLDNDSLVGEHTFCVKYEDEEAKATFVVEFEELPPFEGYYQYPTKEELVQIGFITVREQKKQCKIFQNVLDSMTNEQLVHAVADYPFIVDGWNVYESVYEGYVAYDELSSDAWKELLKRDGGKEACIAYIEEKYIRNQAELDVTNKEECKKLESFLYYVRYNDIWKEQFTEEQKAIIREAASSWDTEATY